MKVSQKIKIENLPLTTTDPAITHLQDFAGRWLIIYFYPKDSSSGCTKQAKDFSEYYGLMQKHKVNLLGVSKDGLNSHRKFIENVGIPFPLASDLDHILCNSFGVIKEKTMYGRKYLGIERSTFIINPQQEIVSEFKQVKVPGHAKEVWQICKEYLGK